MLLTLNFQHCVIKNPHFRVAKKDFFFPLRVQAVLLFPADKLIVCGGKNGKNKILRFFPSDQGRKNRAGLQTCILNSEV